MGELRNRLKKLEAQHKAGAADYPREVTDGLCSFLQGEGAPADAAELLAWTGGAEGVGQLTDELFEGIRAVLDEGADPVPARRRFFEGARHWRRPDGRLGGAPIPQLHGDSRDHGERRR